jgi:acyl phosphate:glycerol-3-phosphate acyltransferase
MFGSDDLGPLALPLVLAAVSGYLLGAVPFGYLVARSRGVNIFTVGSRSPGATNVGRVLGTRPRNMVFALDVLKGAVAAGWPLLVAWGVIRDYNVPSLLGYVGLACALVGHSFSCFTWFKGGKGVSTAVGGLLVLLPVVAAIATGIWAIVFFTTRYVSLASIIAALSLPVSALLTPRRGGWLDVSVASLIALFVVFRHRANIVRLLGGTEQRFEGKKCDASPQEGKP